MTRALIAAFITPFFLPFAVWFATTHLPGWLAMSAAAFIAALAGGRLGLKITEDASRFEKAVGVAVFVAIELGYALFVAAAFMMASSGDFD